MEKDRTGILSNFYNDSAPAKKFVDMVSPYLKEYGEQASDAGSSYKRFAENDTSNFEKLFGESKFSNKAQEIARGGQDLLGYGYNIAREGADIIGDIGANSFSILDQGVKRLNNVFLPESLEYDVEGQGQGTKSVLTDLVSYLSLGTAGDPTTMLHDANQATYKYAPVVDKQYLKKIGYKGPMGGDSLYESWKNASGFNTSTNTDRIKAMTDKEMSLNYTPQQAYPAFMDWTSSTEPGGLYDPSIYSIEDRTSLLSDRKDLFNRWYEYQSNDKREEFNRKNEWRITGQDYADWASKEYQNEMLSKHGKYALEGIDLNPNISPYEDIDVRLKFANDDYIKAYNDAGGFENEEDAASSYSIGEPTEFDYGMFDRSPMDNGPGITGSEEDQKALGFLPRYNYNTPEVKKFANNPINVAPEFLIPGKGIQTLGNKLGKYANNLPGSRLAREIAPGALQWGSKSNFGIPKFKENMTGWSGGMKRAANVGFSAIDNFRSKGGQGLLSSYLIDQSIRKPQPNITVEFDNGYVDETGTIQPK